MAKETSMSETENRHFDDILIKSLREGNLTKEEIVYLLSIKDEGKMNELFLAADDVRKTGVGNDIYLRGIIEFSNICRQNCLYCGLRRDNDKITRYRIPEDEILSVTHLIKDHDISTVVLQSGEDDFYDRDYICRLVSHIKEETGLVVTMSIGERSRDDYYAFKEAGADRYLLKHETASMNIHKRLRPGTSFENRLLCLHWLKELDYEVGTGMMVGLPMQNEESLANDIILMKQLDADMIGIGPFIAHPQTPLANYPDGDLNAVLKVIAVTRIVTRTTNIPATTALEALNPGTRMKALSAGANVVMPDFTPFSYKQFYDIYPGKSDCDGSVATFLSHLELEIAKIGCSLGKGGGYRRRPEK
jgi:biotin synthase